MKNNLLYDHQAELNAWIRYLKQMHHEVNQQQINKVMGYIKNHQDALVALTIKVNPISSYYEKLIS